MRIINQTGMLAEVYIAADKETRDHFLVVVKGSFSADSSRLLRLADQPVPLKYADEHYGDPGTTSIRYECDFVLTKPAVDILLNGHAYAPGGKKATEVDVTFQVGSMIKRIRVFGDRTWQPRVLGYGPTAPEPFLKMPLVYERAFGGNDATASKPEHHGTELRNPIGRGYRVNSDPYAIIDSPLPNLEDPSGLISGWKDRPRPMCFGCLGRGWPPRIKFAGTYDQKWLDGRFPFLPLDFDTRYFQSSPPDQQLPAVQGGEEVRCSNLTPEGNWEFQLPTREFSVIFVFRHHHAEVKPHLDTVLVEPDELRVVLTWRASLMARTKLHDLRQILVGSLTPAKRRALNEEKPIFASLEEYIEWRRAKLLT